jgi:O-antigen ligase
MRKVTQYLLWLYVFTVSWDTVALAYVGSVSRLTGLAVIASALLTIAIEGRLRKPDASIGLAVAFGAWSALSLLWTVSYNDTWPRAMTYVQLVASLCVIREFVRKREQLLPLMLAFCLGAFVPIEDLFSNFMSNKAAFDTRFTGSNLNADMLGLTLVIGLPMAWHLIMQRRRFARFVGLVYFVVAPMAVLLTATRGAFLAGIVAFAIVPLTLRRQSAGTYVVGALVVIGGIAAAAWFVPEANWDRVFSTHTEIAEGTMSRRTDIWKAGLDIVPDHALLGVGAGAYGAAVDVYMPGKHIYPHNLVVGLLVEEGIVGLSIFLALLGVFAWIIVRTPPADRTLWSVLMLTWLVGAMSVNWEYVKITWVLFGMVAAQHVQRSSRARSSARHRTGVHVAPGSLEDRAQLPAPAHMSAGR